ASCSAEVLRLLLGGALVRDLVGRALLLAPELRSAGADVVELALRLGRARRVADGGAGEHDLRGERERRESQQQREKAAHATMLAAGAGAPQRRKGAAPGQRSRMAPCAST